MGGDIYYDIRSQRLHADMIARVQDDNSGGKASSMMYQVRLTSSFIPPQWWPPPPPPSQCSAMSSSKDPSSYTCSWGSISINSPAMDTSPRPLPPIPSLPPLSPQPIPSHPHPAKGTPKHKQYTRLGDWSPGVIYSGKIIGMHYRLLMGDMSDHRPSRVRNILMPCYLWSYFFL